jgi:two-component system response regulator AtoC
MKKLILLVHTEDQVRQACSRILGKEGYRVESVPDPLRLTELIAKHEPCLLLTAIRMPEKDGFEVLREARAADRTLPVIAITTHASIPSAVKFLKSGGANYLASPFTADQLADAVREALDPHPRTGSPRADDRSVVRGALESIIGTSRSILDLKTTLFKVARTDVNVLIQGETGTGKELVAKAVHELSPRSSHTFLPVDCAALPPSLLESELFGHEKGAFTGADRSRHGLFEAANQGTVFLDEIGELDVSTQSKLFRVLQEGKIRQIGGRRDTIIDVRVIAATNRDLEKELREGTFREELYFRLNVVSVSLPSLRERKEDIPLLANYFFELFKRAHDRDDLTRVDSSFTKALMEYRWPGNIRELRNVVERAVVLSDGPGITASDCREPLTCHLNDEDLFELDLEAGVPDYSVAKDTVFESFDKKYFQRLMVLCHGNLSEVARKSGIGRKTLYNKLNRIGIIPFDSSDSA